MRAGLRRAQCPTRQRSASSRLASVAERPQVRSCGRKPRSRASASSDLHAALAAHELVPFVDDDGLRGARSARASRRRDSISVRLSGVVTSAVGRRCDPAGRARRRRCRRCARRRSSADCSASRGTRRARAPVSLASARNGVIQRSDSGGGASAAPRGPSSIGPSAAAYVLPMPVGACTSPLSPAAYAAHTSSWNEKGAKPSEANQSRMGANESAVCGILALHEV